MAASYYGNPKSQLTEEEIKQQKLEELKTLIANNEEALNNMFNNRQ